MRGWLLWIIGGVLERVGVGRRTCEGIVDGVEGDGRDGGAEGGVLREYARRGHVQ